MYPTIPNMVSGTRKPEIVWSQFTRVTDHRTIIYQHRASSSVDRELRLQRAKTAADIALVEANARQMIFTFSLCFDTFAFASAQTATE